MAGRVIEFYRVRDEYGCFSNFSPHPIVLDSKTWPTSEHYFQAQKFAGTTHEDEVRLAKSPREAADMGRDRGRPLRKDWEAVKDQVMLKAVRAKFQDHPDIRRVLLDTGDAYLVEHTRNDRYWGDGGDGSGRNMLGKILMQVRYVLADRSFPYIAVGDSLWGFRGPGYYFWDEAQGTVCGPYASSQDARDGEACYAPQL